MKLNGRVKNNTININSKYLELILKLKIMAEQGENLTN
jgi:hypothetical protein